MHPSTPSLPRTGPLAEIGDRASAAALIETEIIRLHEESYGAGVAKTEVHLLGDTVMVLLDVELTRAEQTLLDHGSKTEVRNTREAFQAAIGPTFIALVERATGRRVNSFMSHMNVDPPYSVELFRLD